MQLVLVMAGLHSVAATAAALLRSRNVSFVVVIVFASREVDVDVCPVPDTGIGTCVRAGAFVQVAGEVVAAPTPMKSHWSR